MPAARGVPCRGQLVRAEAAPGSHPTAAHCSECGYEAPALRDTLRHLVRDLPTFEHAVKLEIPRVRASPPPVVAAGRLGLTPCAGLSTEQSRSALLLDTVRLAQGGGSVHRRRSEFCRERLSDEQLVAHHRQRTAD